MNEYRAAFDLLLTVASPEAATRALRAGLQVLVSEEPPRVAANSQHVAHLAPNGADHPSPRASGDPKPRRGRPRKAGAGRKGRPPKVKANGRAKSHGEILPPAELSSATRPNSPLTKAERTRLAFLASTGVAHRGIERGTIDDAIGGVALEPATIAQLRSYLHGPVP